MNRVLKIDPEFEKIPAEMSDEQFNLLEENILKDGRIFNPIVVWNDVIVDGHNRYKIAMKHPEIPFDVYEMDFDSRESAMNWIWKNQFARRNLSDKQMRYIIAKRNECIKRCEKLKKSKATGVSLPKSENGEDTGTVKMTYNQFLDYLNMIAVSINAENHVHSDEAKNSFLKIQKWALEKLEAIFEDTNQNIRRWLKNEICVFKCRKTGNEVEIKVPQDPVTLYGFLIYCYLDQHGEEQPDELVYSLLKGISQIDPAK